MDSTLGRGRGRAILVGALLALALSLVAIVPGVAAAASNPGTALIDGESVTFDDGIMKGEEPISLEQYAAEHAGYTVTVRSGPEWEAMTAAEFAQYQVLIVGDPDCSSTAMSAAQSAHTWTGVVMGEGPNPGVGNRVLVGTDPEYHYAAGSGGAQPTEEGNPASAGAEHLVQDGITFAGGVSGATGVYFDTSCSDLGEETEEVKPAEIHQPILEGPDGLDKTLVLNHLTTVPTTAATESTPELPWTEDVSPPCGGSVRQIAANPVFDEGPTKLLDSDIQGWECSVHITFPQYPADWTPLAVATDTETHPTCGVDPEPPNEEVCGESYVLVAGEGIVARAPDLTLTPEAGQDAAGGTHSVTATVTKEERPVPSVRVAATGTNVSFLVTGQNKGVTGTCTFPGGGADPECLTDGNGQVVFTYSDAHGAGKDTIIAGVDLEGTIEQATASEVWVGPTATTTTTTTTTTPKTSVLPAKAVKAAAGTAHVASVRGCVAETSYLAQVHGSSITAVRFVLDGHTVKTLHKPSHGAFALRVALAAGARHHLSIHVTFSTASGTKAKTFNRTIARCAARHAVAPRFTG